MAFPSKSVAELLGGGSRSRSQISRELGGELGVGLSCGLGVGVGDTLVVRLGVEAID